MFKIESYVTPILLSYVDKYVRDFKPEDAQVSLWGGGVALHNLVLKPDVLQREVSLPFTLVSGRIHELLIQVPWTKIMSEPIVVTIDTIECVLSLNQPTSSSEEGSQAEAPTRRPQMETPPGYMQALVKRIVTNIALNVHHLIVKYVQDDMVLSLNVKHFTVDSAGPNWAPAFADIDQTHPVIRRLVHLDDLTLCLDSADADGKIRFFQEPLLYRCQLDLRVLTRLVSANTRRASSLSVQARSSKMAWSVTSDQLTMLLRLYREKGFFRAATPVNKPSGNLSSPQTMNSSSNTGEPARTGSWTDWAWSWLPQWSDRETDDEPARPTALPVCVSAYLDDIYISFKDMPREGSVRKRAQVVLELSATHAALKYYISKPVAQKFRFGIRQLTIFSKGRCVCGQMDYRMKLDDPIVYLKSREPRDAWSWPVQQEGAPEMCVEEESAGAQEMQQTSATTKPSKSDHGHPEEPQPEIKRPNENEFWANMAPLLYVDFSHERSPPMPDANPYENPPIDFEYSDWIEECNIKIKLEPISVLLCMGLFHRLYAIRNIYRDLPVVPAPEPTLRTLTVEENDALHENLPERRISVEAVGMKVCVAPWDHTGERARPSLIFLNVEVGKSTLVTNGPLYPFRVCSAACQMPDDNGPLWRGARFHITLNIQSMQATLAAASGAQAKPCARMDVRAVLHILLNKSFFTVRESIHYGLSLKIGEANLCGSTARLQAAYEILRSLIVQNVSCPLRFTSLATDAFTDDDAVAIDLTAEDFILRAFITNNTNTVIVTLQSAKATAYHEPCGEPLKQAWVFSGPDAPISSPYLRLAVQWVQEQLPTSLDYIGLWTEPTGICVDPLLIAWLAYKPVIMQSFTNLDKSSTLSFLRRRYQTQKVGRKPGDLSVHHRPRSASSSSKTQETKPEHERVATTPWWHGDRLLQLHGRLRHMLINVELGLSLLYVTMTSASAIDCGTIRDAVERHASERQQVLAISLGRISMYSSVLTKHFWHDIKHDGPTFVQLDPSQPTSESFPWRLRLADVSCYTLAMREVPIVKYEGKGGTKRSQLKCTLLAKPRNVLELVTTTVTLSVVTKTLQIIAFPKLEPPVKKPPVDRKGQKTKYFTSGMEFKPTTLKEFVRGPAKRKKEKDVPPVKKKVPDSESPTSSVGPVISLGVHLHADTPPLILRLEQDQVHLAAATVHCFQHIVSLIKRPSLRTTSRSMTSLHSRSPIRSVSEEAPPGRAMGSQSSGDVTDSEHSDLVPLYVADEGSQTKTSNYGLKTFFYLQWVVSRITVVGTEQNLKLAFDIDDVIVTSDLQEHYNQLKIKIASVSIRHFEKTGSLDWIAGPFNGRVLEARDAFDTKGEDNFLCVTITQARISTLPANWKKELHPKLLEHKSTNDIMWEVFATLAPLEMVIEPRVLREIVFLLREMQPRSYCPLQRDVAQTPLHAWQWPFFYVTAGGLRLLLTQDQQTKAFDDTIVFTVGSVIVTPHPDNPIIRRSALSQSDGAWAAADAGNEGRQYEIHVKNVSVYTARFHELVKQEESFASEAKLTRSRENPALKWGKPIPIVEISPLLHTLDISSVLAPALYLSDTLTCGPAMELNLVSDCYIELSLDQVVLLKEIMYAIYSALRESEYEYNLLEVEIHAAGCPYATLIEKQESMLTPSQNMFHEGTDSGYGLDLMETDSKIELFEEQESTQTFTKSASRVAFVETTASTFEYLEVFVTMGVIKVSLYFTDDGSPEAVALRPPVTWDKVRFSRLPEPLQKPEYVKRSTTLSEQSFKHKSTDNIRDASDEDSKFHALGTQKRSHDNNIPLLHVSLWQPNFYYWRRKTQKTMQFSLFNAWVGLGSGDPTKWLEPIFMTAKGTCDPMTDIPPALATVKVVAPCAGLAVASNVSHGSMNFDVERPVQVEISVDSLQRLKNIYQLMKTKTLLPDSDPDPALAMETLHPLYEFRKFLLAQSVENVMVTTSQVSFVGSEGAAGWASSSLQIGVGSRPMRRLCARALLSAAVVSAGPPGDARHVLLHPLMCGVELESNWEAWRYVEGALAYHVPFTRVCLDVDRAIIDLRPPDLAAVRRFRSAWHKLIVPKVAQPASQSSNASLDAEEAGPSPQEAGPAPQESARASFSSTHSDAVPEDHFYKDDLRSGAFKIVTGGQLPMAYQVTLHDNAVSWRYPYPRAITRLVAFPLPSQETETPCVLELYNNALKQWEQHSHFTIPVDGPVEKQLYNAPPDAVFARMWRYRAYEVEEEYPRFVFDHTRFQTKADPLAHETAAEMPVPKSSRGVTTEQLAGVVRVDSCFSPRMAPHIKLDARLSLFIIHLHNDLPPLTSQNTSLEGYYVSKPLMRSHRVLALRASNASIRANFGSPAGALLVFHNYFESDLLNCSTGTMEPLVTQFRSQAGISLPMGRKARARLALARVQAGLHVPTLRTLQALAIDWETAYNLYIRRASTDNNNAPRWSTEVEHLSNVKFKEPAEATALEGRVTLWIHNTTASALKVGQEGTDEVVPLGPGTSLAYRWRSPTAPKKLRFSIAGPTADWHWSASIPFTAGTHRIRLNEGEPTASSWLPGAGVFLHSTVEDHGARRSLSLAGRLCAANMLRQNLLYKVRVITQDRQWRTISSGELAAERIGNTIICTADSELVFKIKFTDQEMGWSGDIPLKQCPKENVPWLVKVPNSGDPPYTCVWCRVVRARSDSRLLVSVWPLYVLHSHLPLDTDVLISTKRPLKADDNGTVPPNQPVFKQATPGRGTSTHLIAPGTTAARHTLFFQYTGISSPVTGESIPLHYGVTDASVFDKRAPVFMVEEVLAEINQWLERSGPKAVSSWPYSIVVNHWPGAWRPAKLQPRSDVTVRYQAIHAGGGCSLEIQLCPVVMLCNATPIALTLRSHDAAPLCKLDPGTAITPSSIILRRPFFLSVEMGRETYVSGQLAVTGVDLGRYGTPGQGLLALDHAAEVAVLCDHKVALLTMFYEIKEEINVLGITSTYVLMNRMKFKVLVSAMAVPSETRDDIELHPSRFKVIDPTPEGSEHGTPLCRFFLVGRWRGGSPEELRLYLTVSVNGAQRKTAPVRVGQPPLRRALCIINEENLSIPVVLTQVKMQGRWVLTLSEDPCPEFVVCNMTMLTFRVAQPTDFRDEPSTSQITVRPECSGVGWQCTLSPVSMTHYSTPGHCARYPPPTTALIPSVTFLVLALYNVDTKLSWCSPIAVADGEQLVQVAEGVTVKLRLRTNPHSTLVEIKDVDENDISASEIRKRLFGIFSEEDDRLDNQSGFALGRTDGADKLLLSAGPATIVNIDPTNAEIPKSNLPPIKLLASSSIPDSILPGTNIHPGPDSNQPRALSITPPKESLIQPDISLLQTEEIMKAASTSTDIASKLPLPRSIVPVSNDPSVSPASKALIQNGTSTVTKVPVDTAIPTASKAPFQTGTATVSKAVDTAIPTASEAPIQTGTATVSKAVDTAIPTASEAPIQTETATVSKVPVDTAIPTASKAPIQPGTATVSKVPVDTAIPTASKDPIDSATPTAFKAPFQTGTATVSKAVDTAIPTASEAPIQTGTATVSKVPVDTAIPTASKAPIQPGTATDSKVPVDTAIPTASKDPIDSATPTASKAPFQTGTATVSKAVDTAIPTASEAPIQTGTATVSKVPVDTAIPTASKAPIQPGTATVSKVPVDTAIPTASKDPIDSATPTASKPSDDKATFTASKTPVDNTTPAESNAPAVETPSRFWPTGGLRSFFGSHTPFFGSYEPIPDVPPVSAEVTSPAINTAGPSESETARGKVPSRPDTPIGTAAFPGTSPPAITNVPSKPTPTGTVASETMAPVPSGLNAPVSTDVPGPSDKVPTALSGPKAPVATEVPYRLSAPGVETSVHVKLALEPSNLSSTHTPLGSRNSEPEIVNEETPVPNSAEVKESFADFSTVVLLTARAKSEAEDVGSSRTCQINSDSESDKFFQDFTTPEWNKAGKWSTCDRLRVVAAGFSLELAATHDERPLVALHLDRAALAVRTDPKRIRTTISIANVQIDNLQYETGQFDFAVIASTRAEVTSSPKWLPMWNSFGTRDYFKTQHETARAVLKLTHDKWTAHSLIYRELTEVEARLGPLALYVEDAYVTALAGLARAASPASEHNPFAEEAALRSPLRLRLLLIHPLELTLTLHTAVRMYIALDHSPLTLGAFKLNDVMTSTERLTHALTVHYLSAAILGAGWVVGGLELLGAPGALAARVSGGARGGVRGVASAAAAALLRSLSAWASSLARNLDLLAGDEDHIRRSAAARRRPPASLMAGLVTGITNFAINILGAVGGLAHHPLVSIAVGETESSAMALRRGIIGAFAKPLSATADLVAFAGHGLLSQTGWDPEPQARRIWMTDYSERSGWQRDCVRWVFRLASLDSVNGFRVLLDSAPLQLIMTHKFLVVADPESERIVEMIDFKFCTIHPFEGGHLELSVTQKRISKVVDTRGDEDDEYEISAAAMARVARYTGAGPTESSGEARVLTLVPTPGTAPSLHSLLLALIHQNHATHFSML